MLMIVLLVIILFRWVLRCQRRKARREYKILSDGELRHFLISLLFLFFFRSLTFNGLWLVGKHKSYLKRQYTQAVTFFLNLEIVKGL